MAESLTDYLHHMPKDQHPFFCTIKGVRKTAIETPEYLTPEDWSLLAGIVAALEANDRAKFDQLIEAGQSRYGFFYRIIGWPEGLGYYCGGSDTYRQNCFANFIVRDLPGFHSALSRNLGDLFANAPAFVAANVATFIPQAIPVHAA